MLEKLTVQNIALIDRAEMTFCAGLNVLSGETGAGKSVVLDSIEFALGAKADKSMIRHGQEECFVRAEFITGENARLKEALADAEIEEEDALVITRRFNAEGKSAIRVNGCAVTAAMLRKITACLVDVHGQSEHFYLLKEANQLHLLDKMGGSGVETAKNTLKELLLERKTILSDIERLGGDEGERNRRLDVLKYQIDEIERANLRENEEEELLATRNKIAHAERILEGLKGASECLLSDGSGVDGVRTAIRALSGAAKYDESLNSLVERLEGALAELSDVADDVERAGDGFEFDEREAERVENRLDELKTLKKKYGGTIENVLDFLERARQEAQMLEESDERYAKLSGELTFVNQRLFAACEDLTAARKETAHAFSARVTEELKTLNISSARFEIGFAPYTSEEISRANSDGLDGVKFLFSANAGEPLKELGKIISGGEMSRFMLAIKAQLSAEREIGTYVFDEIDAGISGKTARVVAEKFVKIAKNTQIIAVSHLAQIAAFADRQLLIEKTQSGEKTMTNVKKLDGELRVKEIARLLGGEEESALAVQHAEELLNGATVYKKSL